MRLTLVLTFVALGAAACGSMSSMMSYDTVRTAYAAEFFANDQTLVMRATNQPGMGLVPFEANLEHGKVVIALGIYSGGSGVSVVHCIRLAHLSPPSDWAERTFFREPSGRLVKITAMQLGAPARDPVSRCVQ